MAQQWEFELYVPCLKDESLRISVEVMTILENRYMRMHAADYRAAAAHLMETLRNAGVDELVTLARSRRSVLCDAAEAALIDLGADELIGDGPARTGAKRATAELLGRL